MLGTKGMVGLGLVNDDTYHEIIIDCQPLEISRMFTISQYKLIL